MFRDEYRKDIEAVGPTEEQLARLMAALAEQEERPVKTVKLTFKTVLLAAALCAAMAVTVLAVSPGLRESLGELLSGFEPYVQTVDGTTAVADDIEIKVVSAMSDQSSAHIYFEVRDLKGERVSGTSRIGVDVPEIDGESCSRAIDNGYSLVYDPESNAAILDFGVQWYGANIKNATMKVQFFNLISSIETLDIPFPQDIVLTDQILESETLEDGRVVLKPGQTSRTLETEDFALSSFGFGADDRIHFLYQIYDKDFNPEESSFWCNVGSKGDRAAVERGETNVMNRENRYLHDRPKSRLFQENGVLYYDVCYNAGIKDFEDVLIDTRIVGRFCTGEKTEGPWELEVSLDNAPARTVNMDDQLLFNGEKGKSLSLTPLSATLTTTKSQGIKSLSYPMALYFSDGTIISDIYAGGKGSTESELRSCTWVFDEPIVPEDVVGVAIGKWYIPIEGNTAQPGRWLSELP